MFITRRLEFDAGHRIPDHKSQCRHLHGHRYAIEITLSGSVIDKAGDAANGMVMDFSQVKDLAKQHLVDAWDHAFLAFAGDKADCRLPELAARPQNRHSRPRVPTAENLARIAFECLDAVYRDTYGNQLRLIRFVSTKRPTAGLMPGAPSWIERTKISSYTARTTTQIPGETPEGER
jgi:6-pyruvoyltetrahydropterin/6-carboxytetrahydropterin synthase